MYKELILELTKGNKWVNIQPPCQESVIVEAEKTVGYVFPLELKQLMRELNGDNWLLLSAEQIIEHVRQNREAFYPLFKENFSVEAFRDRVDRFLFFATNGCGDYYGYRVSEDGVADENAIYLWEHESITEECCWRKVASSLAECITRYYRDEI